MFISWRHELFYFLLPQGTVINALIDSLDDASTKVNMASKIETFVWANSNAFLFYKNEYQH